MNNLNWCLNTWLIHNLNFPLIFYFLLSNDWVSLHISLLLLLLFLLFIYIFYLTFDHLPVLSCCLYALIDLDHVFFYRYYCTFQAVESESFFNCIYGQLAQISRYRYGIPNFAHVKKNCSLPITRTLTNSKLVLTRTKFNFPWISSIQCNFTLGNSNPR